MYAKKNSLTAQEVVLTRINSHTLGIVQFGRSYLFQPIND